MELNINTLKDRAGQKAAASQKLFTKLKRNKPNDLDKTFHTLHEDEFDKIDCLECANCCKTTSPIFYQSDIERLAKTLKLKVADFISQYLYLDRDKDYVLKSSPCPFLANDNTCIVYESRPTACREYPHTNRKRMYQILDLTLRNTAVCPAVFNIVEELKKRIK